MTATIKTTNLQHGSSGSANIVLASDGSTTIADGTITAVTTASLNGGQLAGFRNRIINGNGVINQRGAQTGLASGGYFSDRWSYSGTNTAVVNGSTVSGYIEVDVTTADASLGVSDQAHIRQKIEADNVSDFLLGTASAKTVTLSFKHKHTKTGTYCVFFLNSVGNRSYVSEYTQSVSDTEETATVTLTLDTTGTWVTSGNGNGLLVGFSMGSGSTYHATADTWTAGTYFATSNQVNALDSTSNYFRITDVQLEIGSDATPFEQRGIGTELALCQRYYEKTLSQGTTSSTGQTSGALIGIASSTTNIAAQWTFKQTKRATPTVTLSSFNGTSGSWANLTANTDFAVTQPWGVGDNGFARLDSTGMTAGAAYWGFATASAEL